MVCAVHAISNLLLFMFQNYVKIALRNLAKYKGYTFINVSGLAIGLASCVFIFLFVTDELSYDRFHEQADQLYRVTLDAKLVETELAAPIAPAPMAATLVEEFPEVQAAARLFTFGGERWLRHGDRRFLEEQVVFADSTFFELFSFPLVAGDARTALTQPRTMVLTEAMAEKYFGRTDVVDESIYFQDTTAFRITGVLADLPSNSHLDFDFLISMVTRQDAQNTFWVSNNFMTYVLLHPEATREAVDAKFADLVKKYAGPQIRQFMGAPYEDFLAAGNYLRYRLQPVTDIHLHSGLQFEVATNSDIAYVYIFSAIGIFLLLIACINFMNLATARSANRAKEVGMRKVLGSSRRQLVQQFLSESMLLSVLAFVLAIVLVVVLIPVFNGLTGKAFTTTIFANPVLVGGMILFALVVGLLAGSYPALFLSSFRPAAVLKGELQSGAKNSALRNSLVILQFAISIALIVGTIVVYNQLNYVQNQSLGFDKEHVVVIQQAGSLRGQQEAFKQRIKQSPRILQASGTAQVPGGLIGQNAYLPEGSSQQETRMAGFIFADLNFVQTLDIPLAEGRAFSQDFPSDSSAYIINEAAVALFGWDQGVGKRITVPGAGPGQEATGEVIGVMEDFHYRSLHEAIAPIVLQVGNGPMPNILVRIQGTDIPQTLGFLEQTWNEFVSNQPFYYTFLDDDFAALYRAEQQLSKIFTGFAVLAILIACLGLFGLASFMTEQRTKEIGVRKVLGASVSQVVFLLSKEFTKLVMVAFVVAAPLAYFAMDWWLQDFAYHTPLGVGTFVLAGVLALLIAWLTVSYQSIKAAFANPVDSLQYE